MYELPVAVQVGVALLTMLSAAASIISALSSAASKRAASDAQAEAIAAWKLQAKATDEASVFQKEQAGRDRRENRRMDLRDWFDARRSDATPESKAGFRRLNARIREELAAEKNDTLVSLMDWASEVQATADQEQTLGNWEYEEAHRVRVEIKHRFRDHLARWVIDPDEEAKAISLAVAAGIGGFRD